MAATQLLTVHIWVCRLYLLLDEIIAADPEISDAAILPD